MKKFKFHLLTILFLVFFLYSCKKEHNIETDKEFEKGTLLVGIKDNYEIQKIFDIFNSNSLNIRQINGHVYNSTLPSDSLDFVIDELNKKAYINNGAWKAVKNGSVYLHYNTKIITICCSMFNMDENNQNDWIETTKQLKLVEVSANKSLNIEVPIGKEMYWLEVLKPNPYIRWVDLNWFDEIVLH